VLIFSLANSAQRSSEANADTMLWLLPRIGQASVIEVTRRKFLDRAFVESARSSPLCRGEDSLQDQCSAQAANDLDAKRPQA